MINLTLSDSPHEWGRAAVLFSRTPIRLLSNNCLGGRRRRANGGEGEPSTDWIEGEGERTAGCRKRTTESALGRGRRNCAHGITGRNSPEAVSYFTRARKMILIAEISVRIKASNKFSLTLVNWGEISPFSGHGHFPSPVKQNPIRAAQSPRISSPLLAGLLKCR